MLHNGNLSRHNFKLASNLNTHFMQVMLAVGADAFFFRQPVFNDLDRQILEFVSDVTRLPFLALVGDCFQFGFFQLRVGRIFCLIEQADLIGHGGFLAGRTKSALR